MTTIDTGNPADAGSAANLFCTGLTASANGGPIPVGTAAPAGTVRLNPNATGGICDPSFAVWQVGSRTIWSPVANLDIGVEVLYTRFDQNHVGNWLLASQGSRPAGLYTSRDQDTWSGVLRFQRNFWP